MGTRGPKKGGKMKLEKAIELGKEAEKSLRSHKFPDHADALLMLIEAGKQVKHNRALSVWYPDTLLPGETEE